MSHITDYKRDSMLAIVSAAVTNIDDLEITYLQAAGATSDQVNNAWMEVFLANGATSTNFNTAANEFLIALGAPFASLPMNWSWFWITNGGVIGGGSITDPTDIANLALWLDGSDATTMYTTAGSQPFGLGTTLITPGNGAAVGCWTDKSGNDYHMNNSNNGRRPEYWLAQQNGLSAVRSLPATGADPYILYSTSSVLTQDSEVTVLYVANSTTNETVGGAFSNSVLDNTTGYRRISSYVDSRTATRHGGLVQDSTGANNPVNPADVGTEFNQFTGQISGGDITSRLNGAAGTPLTIAGDGVTPNDFTGIFVDIVKIGVEGYNPLIGHICELIVYNAAVSAGDILLLEAYLKDKWATP
jgi:hypothetical protein